MAWLSSLAETYDVEVVDPESNDRATVTLKRLTAGQHAAVADAMFDDEQGEGQARLVLVTAAVLDWTIPVGPPTESKIAELDPVIFLQIYGAIRKDDVNPFGQAALLRVLVSKEQEATTNGASPAPAPSVAADAD